VGKDYVLGIDVGTTGVKTLVFNRNMEITGQASGKFHVTFPDRYGVEQDPIELYENTKASIIGAVKDAGIRPDEIAAAGLAFQRNSWTYWDKKTGTPLIPTSVWSDVRYRYIIDRYRNDKEFCKKYPERAREMGAATNKSLIILQYQREKDPELDRKFKEADVAAGLVDAWVIYKLTGNREFLSGRGHASISSCYSVRDDDWDYPGIEYFDLPRSSMAEIRPDCDFYGNIDKDILGVEIPIYANLADQASSLLGEGCIKSNSAKCTWGTGFYLDVNTGGELHAERNLQQGTAWQTKDDRCYFVEASSLTAGSTLEWMKNNARLVGDFVEMNKLVEEIPDNGGVYFVPALYKMAYRPFEDAQLEGSFMGIVAGTERAHLVRAVLEGVVYSSMYAFYDLENVVGKLNNLRFNGGIAKSDFACQLSANLLGTPVMRGSGRNMEATAMGAAEMAAVYLGWFGIEDVVNFLDTDKVFEPDSNVDRDTENYYWWKRALGRSLGWNDPDDLDRSKDMITPRK